MNFEKNQIVDYYDSRRISCGLVLGVEDRRLKILTEEGKEQKISTSRALIGSRDPLFPMSGTRDEQVGRLKQLSGMREHIKQNVDLEELWNVVGPDEEHIDLEDLSDLVFGNSKDYNSSSALIRAIFEDKIYFKMHPDRIEVPSQESVDQALMQRRREDEKAVFDVRCSDFLASLVNENPRSVETAPAGLIPLLEEAAFSGREWTDNRKVKSLFSQAGLNQEWDPLRVLVTLGVWDEDENIRLRAEKIPVEFSQECEQEALVASRRTVPSGLEDFSSDKPITVDSVLTRDIDDAISISPMGEDLLVGIHITDASHFVDYDSPLDQEIRKRAVSIYLPEETIPMIPPILSEDAASLQAGVSRPAISVIVKLGDDYCLKSFRIVQSTITVHERLSYADADERIVNPQSREHALYQVAKALRSRRVSSGAIIFKDPELSVRVLEDRTIEVSLRDRESPAQIMVSELMILANSLFANFLTERGAPAIFRSQAPPIEHFELGEEYDPVVSYRCKRFLSRGDLGIRPAPHSTMAVDAYTTATSPLRRYSDLVVQRQIKGVLGLAPTLDAPQLDRILGEISYRLERATNMERERQRYFLLRYIEQHRNEPLKVVVLQRFPRFYLVQLPRFGINAALSVPQGTILNPYDRVTARIEKIRPRDDKLAVSLLSVGWSTQSDV